MEAIIVVAYGNRHYDDTVRELGDYLSERGFNCIAAIAAVAEHSIIRQFASGRPDESDGAQLRKFAGRIMEKLWSGSVHGTLELPRNYPYKEYNGIPLKPKTGRKCTKCGL